VFLKLLLGQSVASLNSPGCLSFVYVNDATVRIGQTLYLVLVRVKDANLPVENKVKAIKLVHGFEHPIPRLKLLNLK
jgi:hypothetical protein